MKRIFTTVVAFLLLFSLLIGVVGCENEGETSATTPHTSATPDSTPSAAPKNVVLIVGDGMGIEHIAAGGLAAGAPLAFTEWQYTMLNTDSVTSEGTGTATTDSAAAATALATGILTVNGVVGKDPAGNNLTTLLDLAKAQGKSTGIVTTDKLYGATPAGFSAHSPSRDNTEEILTSQLSSEIDLLCGAKSSTAAGMKTQIAAAGYTYTESLPTATGDGKLYAQLPLYGADATVSLADATVFAIRQLAQNQNGFVLVVEQAHIDKYAHDNDFPNMLKMLESLRETVEAVTAWADENGETAVLVTADHETGKLRVSDRPMFADCYTVGENSDAERKIYYRFGSTGHTADKVGLFVYGATVDFAAYSAYGSAHLCKNTDVFRIVCSFLVAV